MRAAYPDTFCFPVGTVFEISDGGGNSVVHQLTYYYTIDGRARFSDDYYIVRANDPGTEMMGG